MVSHQLCKVSTPKYALGLKIREPLFQKRTFLYINNSNSAPEPTKSVPESSKTRSPISHFGARMSEFGARKLSKPKCFSSGWNSGPELDSAGNPNSSIFLVFLAV